MQDIFILSDNHLKSKPPLLVHSVETKLQMKIGQCINRKLTDLVLRVALYSQT